MKTKTSRKSTLRSTDPTAPTHEEITARAYDVYLERGGTDGHAMEDWLKAEEEVLELHSMVASPVAPRSDAEEAEETIEQGISSADAEHRQRMIS